MTNPGEKLTRSIPSHAVFLLEVFHTNLGFCRIPPSLFRNLCKLSTKPAKERKSGFNSTPIKY